MPGTRSSSCLNWLIPFVAGVTLVASAPAARAGEAARTLALADFAVRAEPARIPELAWLGAALPELLQAKMQLFTGARVLDRLRLPSPDPDQSPDLSARSSAEVLLLGSVEVQPGSGTAPPIKVQARAVETESGRIISEAAFSATAELSSLLRVAEDLARTLADGLGFTYTPAQLAYAEPSGIDALKLYLKGHEFLARGRPREAVHSFQGALDGNAGTYYAAAHRAQGEAYRLLSASLSGAEQRAVSDEYLRKFREDALAASGALFDLGMALEANGLWRDAAGTYEDYLKVVGTEGETVRWSFTPSKALSMNRAVAHQPAIPDGPLVHLLVANGLPSSDTRWVVLDAPSGTVRGQHELHKLLGVTRDEAYAMRLFGAANGVVYLYWYGVYGEIGQPPPNERHYGNPWVAAVDTAGRVLWRTSIGGERQFVNGDAVLYQGRLVLELQGETVVMTPADGRIRDRYPSSAGTYDPAGDRLLPKYPGPTNWTPNVRHPTGRPGIEFLVDGDTVEFFDSGKSVLTLPGYRPLFKDPPLQGDVLLMVDRTNVGNWYCTVDPVKWKLSSGFTVSKPTENPAGIPGVTTFGFGGICLVFKDGRRVLGFSGRGPLQRPLQINPGDWLMFGEYQGTRLVAVNPDDWSLLDLYRELKVPNTPLGQDAQYMVFALNNDPVAGEIDPRFGMGSTMKGTAVNLVSKSTRSVVGKTFLSKHDWIALDGHDLLVGADGAVTRHELLPRAGVVVTPPGEAHLRIAACRLELDDIPGAEEHLARFEEKFSADPRATLLRMKKAAGQGDALAAARLALAALASGGLTKPEARRCLELIRPVRPEVRDIVVTPVKSRLLVRGVISPGVLACTPSGARENSLHLVVDTLLGQTTLVPTPEFDRGSFNLWYRGKDVYYARDRQWVDSDIQLFRVDLLEGRHVSGGKHLRSQANFIPGMPFWLRAFRSSSILSSETGSLLMRFDPGDLRIVETIDLGGLDPDPAVVGNPTVFTDALHYDCMRPSGEFLLILPESGTVAMRLSVPLDRERVVAVAADSRRLLVGIVGGDFGQYVAGSEGFWFRVESYPIAPDGRRWTYRAEGQIAGNLVIEGERVIFPAFQGRLPVTRTDTVQRHWFDVCEKVDKEVMERAIYEGPDLPASRIALDLVDGRMVAAGPLPANPWDGQPRASAQRIFDDPCRFCSHSLPIHPGVRQELTAGLTVSRPRTSDGDVYWAAVPARPPLRIGRLGCGEDCRLVLDDFDTALQTEFLRKIDPVLVWKDTVYEPIGGGVILVKDFAAGVGLERINSVLGRQ